MPERILRELLSILSCSRNEPDFCLSTVVLCPIVSAANPCSAGNEADFCDSHLQLFLTPATPARFSSYEAIRFLSILSEGFPSMAFKQFSPTSSVLTYHDMPNLRALSKLPSKSACSRFPFLTHIPKIEGFWLHSLSENCPDRLPRPFIVGHLT
jgi:hypothetical protein